jgi:Ca-activated chloride channel family protein
LFNEGREPLYIVYPYEGLSIAESPQGYVDNGDDKKEEAFLKLQEFLLSDEVQDEIQKTGRRTGYSGVSRRQQADFQRGLGESTRTVSSRRSNSRRPT